MSSASMHQIYALIAKNGDMFYLITFLWTALEGETFVIFAGLAAQKGLLNFWWLFVAAFAGTFCGDQAFFFAGRKFGVRILDYMPKLKPSVDRSLGWLEKHAIAFILVYRFMYGIRNISGVAIGMSQLKWQKFVLWNGVAALIWAGTFAGFGYLFGDAITHMHHKTEVVETSVRSVLLTGLALFVLIIAFRVIVIWLPKYRRGRAMRKAQAE